MNPTDAEVLDEYPTVAITHDNIEHYRGRLGRRLLVNRCRNCQRWHEPPRAVCPNCWSHEIEPTEVSGRGTVQLFTVLYVGASTPGVDYKSGYPVVAVELEEQANLRFTAGIIDCPIEDLKIGLPVELTWIDRSGETTPAFRPKKA